jgi:hypothetical protein
MPPQFLREQAQTPGAPLDEQQRIKEMESSVLNNTQGLLVTGDGSSPGSTMRRSKKVLKKKKKKKKAGMNSSAGFD